MLFKVLKAESINGRAPVEVGASIILSEKEAAPFVAAKVLEPIEGEAPVEKPPVQPVPPVINPIEEQ